MRKQIFTFLILMIFGISSALQAQTITGKVVDEKSKEVLPGATISVVGTTNATMTDFDGTFKLDLSAGTWQVKFSFVGYLDQQMDLTIGAGETKDLGEIGLSSNVVGLDEMLVVASFAKDRSTPVAFSNIKPEMIMEKLGSQEYPEILKSTPSVYVTKQGGGYGDSRINLRGFDSNNIGVLINGVPVNDMESGKVYWSNWAGLSDVTRTMQVQRGLGASKLAISSVGGTINILTKTTDAKKGGSTYIGMGNDGYQKVGFTLSTGMYDNGWAATISGSQTVGDGYIKGTNFEAYSYFVNISKRINDKHSISFTGFGAPQWHNQRGSEHYIEDYMNHPDGTKYNSNFGYRNGEVYGSAYAYNEYHKPQLSLNHTWTIDHETSLSTALYASKSSGGGRRAYGSGDGYLKFDRYTGRPTDQTKLTPDGYIDYDAVMDINKASTTGSEVVIAMSNNSHDWYGMLSTLSKQISNINLTVGLDGRYYKGYHSYEIDDLLGGEYFLDDGNVNRDATTPLHEGDIVNYYNVGEVLWEGLFTQAEYVTDQYSAFISGAVSNSSYRRTDYFQYTPEEGQTSDWQNFLAYSGKGGANYNINENHNVFLNGGYFVRAPYLKYTYVGYTNEFNPSAKNERVLSSEFGYGYKSSKVTVNFALYRTEWMDKAMTQGNQDGGTDIFTGLNALHQGAELEITYKPTKKIKAKLMGSMGDWTWEDEVVVESYDENQVFLGTYTAYTGGVHVGNSAQTTAAFGLDMEVLPKLTLGFDANYFDNIYADFDINSRVAESNEGIDAWEMPAYFLADVNLKYKFKIGKLNSTFYGKINNITDTEYIADATDGVNHDAFTSTVFYGFGTTWTVGLKIKF